MTIINVAVTAIERRNNGITQINLATEANDCFVEITSYAPLDYVEVGQRYTLAVTAEASLPQRSRDGQDYLFHAGQWLIAPVQEHAQALLANDPAKALGPRQC